MEPPAYLDPEDPSVHLDKQTQRWVWEDENGREHEWHGKAPNGTRVSEGRWMPVISEEDIAKQAEVYRVAGVDDTVGSSLAPILTCRHLRSAGQNRR